MKWPDVMEDVSSIERRGGKEDFLGGGGFVFLGTSIASMENLKEWKLFVLSINSLIDITTMTAFLIS